MISKVQKCNLCSHYPSSISLLMTKLLIYNANFVWHQNFCPLITLLKEQGNILQKWWYNYWRFTTIVVLPVDDFVINIRYWTFDLLIDWSRWHWLSYWFNDHILPSWGSLTLWRSPGNSVGTALDLELELKVCKFQSENWEILSGTISTGSSTCAVPVFLRIYKIEVQSQSPYGVGNS